MVLLIITEHLYICMCVCLCVSIHKIYVLDQYLICFVYKLILQSSKDAIKLLNVKKLKVYITIKVLL